MGSIGERIAYPAPELGVWYSARKGYWNQDPYKAVILAREDVITISSDFEKQLVYLKLEPLARLSRGPLDVDDLVSYLQRAAWQLARKYAHAEWYQRYLLSGATGVCMMRARDWESGRPNFGASFTFVKESIGTFGP